MRIESEIARSAGPICGAELLALNQRRGERLDIGNPGAVGQRAQSLSQRRSRVDLSRHLRKLASDGKLLRLGFVANDFDRLEQAESRLDAHHQQIEHVGKLASDIDLAASGALVE